MKIAYTIIRILLGLLYIMSSVVVLFKLVPTPEMQGNMKLFNDGMAATGYLMQLVKVTELVCGIAFVAGRFVPLASVVIFPVSLNILLVNIFLSPQALPMAVLILLANLFVAYYHRKNYETLLAAR